MNSWTASGLSGFLSGCFSSDILRNFFLMSLTVASDGRSRIANGSKLCSGFIVDTFRKFRYQIYQRKAPTRQRKKMARENRLAESYFFLTWMRARQFVHLQLLRNSSRWSSPKMRLLSR